MSRCCLGSNQHNNYMTKGRWKKEKMRVWCGCNKRPNEKMRKFMNHGGRNQQIEGESNKKRKEISMSQRERERKKERENESQEDGCFLPNPPPPLHTIFFFLHQEFSLCGQSHQWEWGKERERDGMQEWMTTLLATCYRSWWSQMERRWTDGHRERNERRMGESECEAK